MHITKTSPRLRLSVLAVNAALLALAAPAQAEEDPALTALTTPRRTVEIGVRGASDSSAKADETSGWTTRQARVFGKVDLSGGGAWDSADATRWSLVADRLGSRSAEARAEFGVQGSWRIRLGYDELRRQTSDSFQSPYLGVGSSTLSLPGNWVAPVVPRISTTTTNARGLSPEVTASNAIVNGVSLAPTTAQLAQANALQAADLPAFRHVDLYTQRTRHSLAWEQELAAGWAWQAGLAREHTQGLRILPAHSRAVGGDTSSLLPAPVDQDDQTAHLGLAYTAEGAQAQLRYETSAYTNHITAVGWNLWASPATTAAVSVAPSNQFNKLLANGSLALGAATTLQAHASYSRASQDEPLLVDSTAPLVPVGSAQALVVSESAGLKLLHKATPRLGISAGYKYELRDNRTPVQTFGYYDNNNPAAGTSPFAYLFPKLTGLGSNFNLNANTPYSRRTHAFDLDAQYRYTGGRQVRLAWQTQQTQRWCNGSWINCADAPKSTEHTLRLEGHGPLAEDLQGRVALLGAQRRVRYDENAFLAVVPMAGQTPSTATGALAGSTAYSALQSLGLNGWGPALGLNPASPATSLLGFYFPANNVLSNTLYGNQNRISELPGMRRYNQADRERGSLNASLNWQPGESWSLQGALEAGSEHYQRSVYGLQRADRMALHLDAGYNWRERWAVNAFVSHEDQRTLMASNTYTANSAAANVNGATAIVGGCYATVALRNANNKIDPCLDWNATARDSTTTLGLSATARKLLGGALDLSGSASISDGRHAIDVLGGNYVNNPYAGIAGQASSATAATYFAATPLPDVTARSTQLQLSGLWRLSPAQALRLVYGFQQLRSADWRNEGTQDGALTQLLPGREQAPQFRIHSVAFSFVSDF